MKKGWQTKRLGDLFAFKNGRAFKKEEWTTKGLPIIRIQNLNNEDASFNYFAGEYSQDILVEPGDLLFSWSGTVGSSFGSHLWNGEPGVLNQHIFKIGLRETIAKRYAFHGLRYITTEIEQSVSGAVGLVHITKEKLNEFTLPVPPLAEQQRIVGLLDEAFEGLATAKANAEKNLQNARALFESHLQSVFTQRGPGWVDTALGGVCGFVRGPFGGSLKKSIFVADGYAVYEQQHAIYDQFDDVRYFIDQAKFKEMKRFELLPDDLIMSCSGTMGRVAIVPKDIKRGIINQALLKLTPSSKILNTFLKSWMESVAFQDALKEYSGGAAIQNVASVKILKEIKVPLPSMSDQKRVVEELDALHEETQRLARLYERKHALITALKKSLLHQAFTGEL